MISGLIGNRSSNSVEYHFFRVRSNHSWISSRKEMWPYLECGLESLPLGSPRECAGRLPDTVALVYPQQDTQGCRSKHLCSYCAEGDMGGWPSYTRRHSFNKARAESRAMGNPELCVLWREGTQFSTHPSALVSAAQCGLNHSQPNLSSLPKEQSERQFTRERVISLSQLLQANDKNGLFFCFLFFNLKYSTEKQYATLFSKAFVENTSLDSRRRTCGFQIHSVGQRHFFIETHIM